MTKCSISRHYIIANLNSKISPYTYFKSQKSEHWYRMLARMWNNRNSYLFMMGMQNGTSALEDSLAVSYKIKYTLTISQLSSVQSLSRVRLFATASIAARQASLSITNSQSSLRLTSIESVMPSSHLILCCPLLLLPPIPPSIRVFSNEWTLRMRWPKYWSFSFSISPSNEHPGLISFRMD